MASRGDAREVIDLTQPEVIELDSDGDVVENTGVAPPTNGAGPSEQVKKKRKKRKKKSSAATSAAASRAQSPALEITELGEGSNSGKVVGKKPLADRLAEPSQPAGSEEGELGGDRGKGQAARRDERRDRERERDRDKGRGGDKRRERERRRSRSPRRDYDRERENDRDQPRRRSPSRERARDRRRERRKQDRAPESDIPLFYEDATPAEIPGTSNFHGTVAGPSTLPGSSTIAQTTDGLLLPAHVSLAEAGDDGTRLEVPTAEEGSEDEDYIDYVDYGDDRRAGMVRYWELDKLEGQESKAPTQIRIVCKNCGAEGEHKTRECPVVICLTCGARDEHPTRSCPISKVCFTCGMKGHINRTCPNRRDYAAHLSAHDCERCGSRSHQTNQCPTLWRLYKYVEDDERQEILRVREEKCDLELGDGGEGYIATDEWCYNCGLSGHLGDDCDQTEKPKEHSAFSLYNILSGPFSSEASRPSQRAPRDWESTFPVPMEVGKQGKRRQRDRLERRQREIEAAEDDQDDWFGAAARSKPRSKAGGGTKTNGNGNGNWNARGGAGKIRFDLAGASVGGGGGGNDGGRGGKRQRTAYDDLPGPSRETDNYQIRGAARKPDYRGPSWRDRYDDRYDSRDYYDRYERDRDRDRDYPRGPRYKGGYSR